MVSVWMTAPLPLQSSNTIPSPSLARRSFSEGGCAILSALLSSASLRQDLCLLFFPSFMPLSELRNPPNPFPSGNDSKLSIVQNYRFWLWAEIGKKGFGWNSVDYRKGLWAEIGNRKIPYPCISFRTFLSTIGSMTIPDWLCKGFRESRNSFD